MGDFIAGLEWVDQHAAVLKVVSASLGGPTGTAVNNAVNALVVNGVVVVVASGNDGADACNYSPASATKAITVGATTITDEAAYYSNAGSCVDVLAPGTDITSAWIGSSSATEVLSGTSMACPHVAGVAAQYMARLGADPTAIAKAIKDGAVPGTISDSTESGAAPNRNNPNLFIQADTQAHSAPPSPPFGQLVPDPPPGKTLDVRITSDAYPGDVSWTLSKLNGALVGALVASAQLSTASKPLVQQLWNVALEAEYGTSQWYRFVISDANSDGICCRYGTGNYSLALDGTLLKSGGKFNASESTDFNVSQAALASSGPAGSSPSPSPPPQIMHLLSGLVSRSTIIIACAVVSGALLLGALFLLCRRYVSSRRRRLAREASNAALSFRKERSHADTMMSVGFELHDLPAVAHPI